MLRPGITRALHEGWTLRRADAACSDADNFRAADGWRAATVPGTVYQDLIVSGEIPDPFVDRHEAQVQWVADHDWCYRLAFDVAADERRARMALVFEGLDTFARVWLNGEPILDSDNMFVPARVDVTARLHEGRNELWLRFDSALRRGRALEAHHGRRPLWNGDSSRLYVRKSPYHYGWDWGPTLLTCGPWKPLRLEASDLRITRLHTPVWLADDHTQARIDVHAELDGTPGDTTTLRHRLLDDSGVELAAGIGTGTGTSTSLAVPAPKLWWPAGHGAQPLYTLVTELLDGATTVARSERRLGLRHVRLKQEPVAGEAGRSFHFEVNGREIFTGGANWIPDDNLLNRITPQRYRERVAQAVAANMTMLRVWGGGIYEDDAFYDACDELGVLVWQDFVFACGLYPAHAGFCASVAAEARAAIERLRHRASLAIWCGNNEDYTLAETVGAYGPGKDLGRFDARTIYEALLPALCAELDPGRPYWPGSPYSPATDGLASSLDPSVGDRHSWEVWHQLMLPYDQYAKLSARFVSEFGLQSHPSMAVLEAAIPEAERFPGSRAMQWHNKANSVVGPDGHRRLAVYVADTLRAPPTLAAEVYATQFVQAEAMRHAFEAFRRGWRGDAARACGGALVWQLNDCWPVTSWAVVDCGGHLKPAWHTIRRALAPLACALRRGAGGTSAWVMNAALQPLALRGRWRLTALDGTPLVDEAFSVEARANGTTELAVPAALAADDTRPAVASLSLHGPQDEQAAATAWPEPFRWHRFPDPGLVLEAVAPGMLSLRVQRPAKGVWLAAEAARFTDNFVDVLPGEPLGLRFEGTLDGLHLACLNALQDPA